MTGPAGTPAVALTLHRPALLGRLQRLGLGAGADESLSLEEIRAALSDLADFDPGAFVGPDGGVVPMAALPLAARRAIQSMDVEETVGVDVAGNPVVVGRVARVRFVKRVEALALLAKIDGHLEPKGPLSAQREGAGEAAQARIAEWLPAVVRMANPETRAAIRAALAEATDG